MAFTPGTGAVISFTVEGASGAQRQIEGIGNSMGELSTTAKSSLKELAAFAGVGLSLGALAEQVLGAQRDFDKLNSSLVTATGSTQSAADVFKSLQGFASTTPYSVAEATEAFIKLKNMGLDPSEKALRAYGNTAAAMGKSLDQMIEAVADAATGEFERLKEFGITAAQNGDKVALTFKGTTTTISKSADEIQAYLQKIGNTDFAGAMERRAATLDGAISNLADKWDAFVLKLSQSGLGDAAKGSIEVLADNLVALAGAVATVATAKLASTIDGWVTATRKQITEATAARAATLAAAEADVASTTAKTAQLSATQAMIVVAREEAVAKLSSANSNIAAARAAIAAAEAAGAQSFALRTVRLATAELQVAETQRAVMLAELAVLGRQQASVSAQVTAALAAQATAQTALSGATAAGGIAAGMGARALALLGGPIGVLITVLGLAATAWTWYKQKQDEATADAEQKVGKMTSQIVGDLEKQNEKLRERIELSKQAGMAPAAVQGGEAVERMAELLKTINALKAQGANISAGDSVALIDYQGMYNDLKKVVDANKELKDTLDASSKSATDLHEKLTGVSSSYVADLAALNKAFDDGKIKQDVYSAAVKKLAADTFNGSVAGKEYAKSIDLASEAIKHQADVKAVLNERLKEHIAYLLRIGQISEKTAIQQTADADVKALNDKKNALEGELGLARRKTDSEKEQAALTGQIDLINKQIYNRRKKEGEDLAELDQKRAQASKDLYSSGIITATAERDSLLAQVEAQFQANQEIGLSTKQVAELKAARLENAAALKDEAATALEALDPASELAKRYREQAQAMRDLGEATVRGTVKQDLNGKNLADLNAMLDIMSALDESAQSAAQGMADSFGRVGSAIGSLTTAISGYGRTQAAIAAQLAAATKDAGGDQTKIQRANAMAAEQSAQAQVKSYGDMASAAKGFFKENTAGYKVMQGAEKAFRAYEMAMALETMAKKIFFKETEVAANTTLNATKLAGEATATAASTGLAATEASAWGVTAVVKAIASMPFPLNLAAGAVTLAAVVALGAAVAGGFGGSGTAVNMNSAEERQKVQGTGTVLGDTTAKSESIANSLEIMKTNSDLELDYQNSMLTALQNIETALGGAAKGILQTVGITGGSAFGTVASSDSAIIGASHTQDITDSGVQFSGTFGQLRSGGGLGQQYEDVYTTSDGGMFRSGWSRTDTNYKALSAEAMKPFALIFDNMGDLLVDAGAKLGQDSTSLTTAINNISVDFGVSLRGLTGQDLTDALNAGISVAFDKVTAQLFPTIQQFQQMGEGLGETLVRVASDVQGVDSVFTSMGKSLSSMSLETKELLVEASGGLEKFASSAKSFMQNFYSEIEQRDATKAKLDPVLAQYGLSTEGADAQKMFKDFVLGLDTSTAAGAETYAMLMDLQQAFFDVTDAVASERQDLQDEWDELTMTSAQLQEKALLAYDPSNRALAQQVALQRDLKAATEAASDSLTSTVESLSATKESALAYNNSLLLGTLSTLTPMQKYLETQQQYSAAIDKANLDPSDSAAVSAAQSAATAFLTASQVVNASSAAYIGDKSKVLGDMEQLAAIAGVQMTDAQKQLSALDKQVAGISQLNDTATAIAAAIVNQDTSIPTLTPSIDLQQYAANSGAGVGVLASEVKALREENAAQRETIDAVLAELKLLRADANRNAGEIVDATEGVADSVAKEVGGAMEQAAYLARNPTRVATR